ncbi:inositol monophosphatase family protein [Alkalicaulis satelles]|uniref:Inositol monophosphatase family protein n=1 Tax=Alkalicaulis satelles TaxID=2609175 RepID=A0A5M6ZGN9_9PROT|nr:inositol monophosphatase family protein [Alkalicaulis satelles]KAA5803933.1 inositol monophosphatase family protein [Alkalicaulis satelles]
MRSAHGLQDELVFLAQLADTARPLALRHFRTGIGADSKGAASGAAYDPVTIADRDIETALRALIAQHRPGDGVLGEEHAASPSRTGRTYVIDPIDGTRAYIAGLPTWCVLIALNDANGPLASVIDQPFTGERFLGITGQSAWLDHQGERTPLATRPVTRLDEMIISTTDPGLFAGAEAEAFSRLAAQARVRRYGLDAYGYAALALGGVDLVVENGLKPWDVAALAPVVTGAGGVITDWRGGPCHEGGQVVAAASPGLHARALEALRDAAR